jgi:acetyltransferase-like isoleucine patch superfamily enzyme
MVLNDILVAIRLKRLSAALRLTNFFFQRVVGINSNCPWQVHFTSVVSDPQNIKVHPSVYLSFAVSGNCYIQGKNGIEIGEGTIFAPGVRIISANHSPGNLDTHEKDPPVRIGRNCWIAVNAVILPGVTIEDNVVVGAGSVVTKSFSEGSVIAGVPARLIRTVGSPQEPVVLESLDDNAPDH